MGNHSADQIELVHRLQLNAPILSPICLKIRSARPLAVLLDGTEMPPTNHANHAIMNASNAWVLPLINAWLVTAIGSSTQSRLQEDAKQRKLKKWNSR